MRRAKAIVVASVMAAAIGGCGEDREGTATGGSGTGTTSAGNPGVPQGVVAQSQTIEEEIDAEGGEQTSGPWRIAYIVEGAEGWFERRGGRFVWRPPARGETHHIEILPIESETGRVVPEVPITLEILRADGTRVDRRRLSSYYAEFFHYADNFSLPAAGRYTLRATIEPPPIRRHGEEAEGPKLAEGATVEFRDVAIEPAG